MLKYIASFLLICSLALFISLSCLNEYEFNDTNISLLANKLKTEQKPFLERELLNLKGKTFGKVGFYQVLTTAWQNINQQVEMYNAQNLHKKIEKIEDSKDLDFWAMKYAGKAFPHKAKVFWFWLLLSGTLLGGGLYIIPMFWDGNAGIKNKGVFYSKWTNKGILGSIIGFILILFYIILYFFPALIAEQIALFDVPRALISGFEADRWYMYGWLYTIAVGVMGFRMFAKYRHSNYQKLRTASVMFFQFAFAFAIPEVLAVLNQPYMQFHVAWPLDYSFFYEYRIYDYIGNADWGKTGGTMTFLGIKTGILFLLWGLLFSFVAIPFFTYKYGKRWYCSWVCGCGGLAETLGDPFRQLSDKSLKAWKIERYLIYTILAFAVIMTIAVLINFFTNDGFGFAYTIRSWYGFLIGSIFSGVIGTGFYPLMGNRMWCRFGCPLAAIMGIVQRFYSRFRITTNGGQCISCGNCSTYCEMGIDVRAYAQKGEDIVRASCVGCGVCAAVCPRGVLRLENMPIDLSKINE